MRSRMGGSASKSTAPEAQAIGSRLQWSLRKAEEEGIIGPARGAGKPREVYGPEE